MSEYENVVGGKLRLKGKALDVKAGGVKKKKKKNHNHQHERESQLTDTALSKGESVGQEEHPAEDENEIEKLGDEAPPPPCDDNLTPAERRYIEQRKQIETHRLAKNSNKSHRDRIQDFNQYLANLSEHYDIPKVGPG
ncbi:uncharacterized protein [Aristolochia californica]|uniref:uncharacterized protein n=1 Tax=Aristolochia californica TaxID=171875 RepID=UPI0035DCBE95